MTELLASCGLAYQRANDTSRREYNQGWFCKVYITVEDSEPVIGQAERTDLFQALTTATGYRAKLPAKVTEGPPGRFNRPNRSPPVPGSLAPR